MFSFFKKAPLQKVFPKGYVDIHSHVLPGIDDGAKNMEEAIQLIIKMRSLGVHHIVTTPHISESWPNTAAIIQSKLAEVQQALKLQQITDVEIKAAAEYKMGNLFNNLLKNKELLTIKDNCVLIELGFFNAPLNVYDVLFEMQLAGYKPVLAHPERYHYYYNDFTHFQKLKNAGCFFQLDLLSLIGHYGVGAKHTAKRLLQYKMIDFVGSDAHNMHHLELLSEIGHSKIRKLIAPIFQC